MAFIFPVKQPSPGIGTPFDTDIARVQASDLDEACLGCRPLHVATQAGSEQRSWLLGSWWNTTPRGGLEVQKHHDIQFYSLIVLVRPGGPMAGVRFECKFWLASSINLVSLRTWIRVRFGRKVETNPPCRAQGSIGAVPGSLNPWTLDTNTPKQP